MPNLYTGKGDNGTTYVFDTPKGTRISKTSGLVEALGSLDELNSFLGLCKVEAAKWNYVVNDTKQKWFLQEIIHDIQDDLFIVQAELAGADKKMSMGKVKKLEKWISLIDKTLPPISTFFISGGTELSARFDYVRTLARQAERRLVLIMESEERKLNRATLAYMNRLSSVLYALARYANHIFGVGEVAPSYK